MNSKCLSGIVCFFLLIFEASAGSGNVGDKKTYPAFPVGVTGAWVRIDPGRKMIVEKVDPDSPAAGQLEPGDVVTKAGGLTFDQPDPRVSLGTALSLAEAESGMLTLTILRKDQTLEATVKVPVLGDYKKDWPNRCAKSSKIIRDHARHLAGLQTDEGWYGKGSALWEVMGALFLLSTDDETYLPGLKRFASVLSKSVEERPSGSTWHLGYHLIFLGEYFLKTGDTTVLPAMKIACKIAAEGQSAGAWGHGFSGVSVGYVQSGLMNSAGVTLFLGMTLARECGITVHEEAWRRSLVFFYRNIGHGSIPYGDHRAEIYPDTNGRNAAIACAMGLLEGEAYQAAAQHLAMMVADSYASFEAGHTGGGFNVLWRGISLPLLPDTKMAMIRRQAHMRQLAWYYDLCRLPKGGFTLLPSPPGEKRYASEPWGRGLGLTYTAPKRTLRITGAPRTKHSKATPPIAPAVWGNKRDLQFLSSEHAEGFGEDKIPAHEVQALVEGKSPASPEVLRSFLHHFNPYIRTRAAWMLGSINSDDAYAVIAGALQHSDPRVRRAGCDAISQYDNWRRGKPSKIPREIVSAQFASSIESILNNPASAWWEIDGALNALRFAAPEEIRRNRATIARFAKSPHWYLRESAYWALIGLGKEITGPEFLELAKLYQQSRSVFERSAMNGGIEHLIRKDQIALEDKVIGQYMQMISSSLHDCLFEAGYDPFAARQEAAHRTMMVISDFQNPPFKLIAPQLAEYLAGWEPGGNQHANWLITGNRWQPGLVKIAKDLGKDAGPIIEQFQRCLESTNWNLKDGSRNPQLAVHQAMTEAVKHFESLR